MSKPAPPVHARKTCPHPGSHAAALEGMLGSVDLHPFFETAAIRSLPPPSPAGNLGGAVRSTIALERPGANKVRHMSPLFPKAQGKGRPGRWPVGLRESQETVDKTNYFLKAMQDQTQKFIFEINT